MNTSQLTNSSFEDLVHASFGESISNILGPQTWKAIRFYFDVRLMANEPEIFAGLVERLFGKSAKPLENVIIETLFGKMGTKIEKRDEVSFQALIRIAKAKFLASFSGITRPPVPNIVNRR